MIGQDKLQKYIQETPVDKFPRFLIITGARQSGKKTLIKQIGNKIGCYMEIDKGVDAVREMIDNAYDIIIPVLYFIKDSEKMSPQASNALLKIIEEPPRKAYFAVAVSNLNKVLPTIRSRAMTLALMPYKEFEIASYALTLNPNLLEVELNAIKTLCQTPGQVSYLLGLGNVLDYFNDLENVIPKIGKLTGVEALQISNKIKFKEDDEGIDLMFYISSINSYTKTLLMNPYLSKKDIKVACLETFRLCSLLSYELQIKGINKVAAFDMFLLELRKVWIHIK